MYMMERGKAEAFTIALACPPVNWILLHQLQLLTF